MVIRVVKRFTEVVSQSGVRASQGKGAATRQVGLRPSISGKQTSLFVATRVPGGGRKGNTLRGVWAVLRGWRVLGMGRIWASPRGEAERPGTTAAEPRPHTRAIWGTTSAAESQRACLVLECANTRFGASKACQPGGKNTQVRAMDGALEVPHRRHGWRPGAGRE